MTDLEISKALALAIGYAPEETHKGNSGDCYVIMWNAVRTFMYYRKFDYRDWNVIGPIAEKFDCFPCKVDHGKQWEAYSPELGHMNGYADTPQKAIALAVIGANK